MSEYIPTADSFLNPPRRRNILLAILPVLFCVILIAQALPGIVLPIGEHNDSRTILDSANAILSGHYARSRSLGVPLYEFIVAAMIGIGGTTLANIYSVALAIISVYLFDRLLSTRLATGRRILALVAFVLNPMFLINSSAIIEWMQAVALMLSLLVVAKSILRAPPQASLLIWYGAASTAAVLTRPDMCLFCAALFVAVLWEKPDLHLGVKLAAINAIAAAATLAIFLSLNSISDLSMAVTIEDRELIRRIGLAAVDGIALLGPVGSIASALILAGFARMLWVKRGQPIPFEIKLLMLVLPIVAARQVGLPSKLEFLFPLFIVFLLAAAHSSNWRWLALLAASLALGSVVQISFLDRNADSDSLRFRVAVNQGALAQDFDRRIQNSQLFEPHYLEAVARAAYGDRTAPLPSLQPRIFFPGLISDTGDLIIGSHAEYMLDDPRFAFGPGRLMFPGNGDSRRSTYKQIYICSASLAAAGKGWRVLQPPTPIARIDPTTGQLQAVCRREAR